MEVTDQSTNTANRRSSILTLTVNVGDINDSAPYQVEARMLKPHITSSSDCARWTGIPTHAPLELTLIHDNGTREDITKKGKASFDFTSESNSLFTVETINGAPNVVGNSASKSGSGNLLVQIPNVKTFRVNVSVIGFTAVELKVVPYPEASDSLAVTKIKQITPGVFQKVLVKVH